MTLKKRVLGTAGHIDHGKTSLVRALTGIDCDRLPEEKRRGITIDLGFASWITEEFQIGFVDVPGHERFVKNMLAGIGGIDAALLVVAADESLKPQTREHFAICKLLQIPTGLVAITKSDLVEDDILEIVRLEVEELTRGSFLHKRPIIPVSSTTGAGIPELREAILGVLRDTAERDTAGRLFRLPIDRAFSLKGFGSIVTGTTVSGSVRSDQSLAIMPGPAASRVRSIQVHGQNRESANAGERTSINLPDVELDSLHRGQQLVAANTLRESQVLTVELELLPDVKPLKNQSRIRFHHFSSELLGNIRILSAEGDTVGPGETAFVQIRLESPVVAVSGDRFVIRRYSPQVTIGGGRILDPYLPKMSPGTRKSLLRSFADGSMVERLELRSKLEGVRGITAADMVASTGRRVDDILQEVRKEAPKTLMSIGTGASTRWFHRDEIGALEKRAMDFVRRFFSENRTAASLPKSELIQKLLPADLDGASTEFLLRHLEKEKILEIHGDDIDVPGRAKRLSGIEGDLARQIEVRFAEAGLKPPPVSELIKTINQKPKVIEGVVGYLVKTGTLLRLAEGVYMHKDAAAAAKGDLQSHRGEQIEIGWFKDFFSLSRKIAIPLLEYFDRQGVTKRMGDSRMIL
ncbi:MAG TPA: selenocysteine-specific translation elongation factor [Thermoanaerobaculia bacterium]|nr:selenocysteine-specific translation elongation factor [Thermoanaerobaculia bacterium]